MRWHNTQRRWSIFLQPGSYNLAYLNWVSRPWTSIPLFCFYTGSEICGMCSKDLVGDYHRGRSCSWCHSCYCKLSGRNQPRAQHVRHCSAVHHHIGVRDLLLHKSTFKIVKGLEFKEKVFWRKFGGEI